MESTDLKKESMTKFFLIAFIFPGKEMNHELIFAFNDLLSVSSEPKTRKKLMTDYMKRFLLLSYYNMDRKNIKIAAVINDRSGPKTLKLQPLNVIDSKRIANAVNKANLNHADDKGKGFAEILEVAGTSIFSKDIPHATTRTLIVFASSLLADGLREEVLALRQSGIKIIFIVVKGYSSEFAEATLKPMVTFVRIGDTVTSIDINEGLNEISKGASLFSVPFFLIVIVNAHESFLTRISTQ